MVFRHSLEIHLWLRFIDTFLLLNAVGCSLFYYSSALQLPRLLHMHTYALILFFNIEFKFFGYFLEFLFFGGAFFCCLIVIFYFRTVSKVEKKEQKLKWRKNEWKSI